MDGLDLLYILRILVVAFFALQILWWWWDSPMHMVGMVVLWCLFATASIAAWLVISALMYEIEDSCKHSAIYGGTPANTMWCNNDRLDDLAR